MEPRGQKATLTSSDEAVFTTDIEVESVEKEAEKIFDSTLDQMLTEEIDYENTLDELLENDGQNSLTLYVHQNHSDSSIEKVEKLIEPELFPTEIVKPDISSENFSKINSNFLQKSVPITGEKNELPDPRIVIDDKNFINTRKKSEHLRKALQVFEEIDKKGIDNEESIYWKARTCISLEDLELGTNAIKECLEQKEYWDILS